jgi:hypothetical protein
MVKTHGLILVRLGIVVTYANQNQFMGYSSGERESKNSPLNAFDRQQ